MTNMACVVDPSVNNALTIELNCEKILHLN